VVGQTVGHYRVLRKLGEGGMGEVYLAEDLSLKRNVALKFLPQYLHQDQVARKRFLREAQSAAAIDHPFICNIYEVSQTEDGQDYIVMEYVEGQTLQEKLTRGQLPLKEALRIGMEISEALEEAHKKGVVHRDLKPANIMLTAGGHVKVMDFGLAKKLVDEGGTEQDITAALTREGATLGTLAYMSPEQVRGKAVDTRSDIFSFGIVLYELLSGVHPFRKPNRVDTTDAILHDQPPLLSRYTEDTSEILQHTITKMLAKDPDQRYQSIHEVGTNLNEVAGKLSLPQLVPRVETKRSRIGWLGFGVALILILGLGLGAYLYRSTGIKVTEPSVDSIAVFFFENASGDEDTQILCDGIRQTVNSLLSRIAQLRVVPTSVLERYRGQRVDFHTASAELGVRAGLTGSVLKRGDTLVVRVELTDLLKKELIWAETYRKTFSDIFAVEEDIARRVADGLRLQLTSQESERLSSGGTENPKAYEAFLKGRHFVRGMNIESLEKAIGFLEQAVAEDPGYAIAWAELARAYFNSDSTVGSSRSRLVREQSLYAIGKAIALAPDEAEVYRVRAIVRQFYEWNWQGATEDLLRAKTLKPGSADILYEYGLLLGRTRRFEEALRQLDRTLELEPLHVDAIAGKGRVYYYARRHNEAIDHFLRAEELLPGGQYLFLALTYAQLGSWDEVARLSGAMAFELGLLQAYVGLGEQSKAREILERLQSEKPVRSFELAVAHALLGEREAALEWFQGAIEEREPLMFLLSVDPRFDRLRPDPRFLDLLRRLNLPEETIQSHLRDWPIKSQKGSP